MTECGTDGETPETPDRLPQSDCFDILADQRRCYLIDCLQECETPIALTDLAEEVAIRENDSPGTDVPAQHAERIATSLHHVHIPRLADAGVVEYDRYRAVVTLPREGEYLEQFTEHYTIATR